MSHVYELEGLLLVIEKHAEDTPDFVLTMLRARQENLPMRCNYISCRKKKNRLRRQPRHNRKPRGQWQKQQQLHLKKLHKRFTQ